MPSMKIGTRSLLFGAHQFLIHPWFVAAAWWRLYSFPFDPRLWVAFFVHDLGYWGKPNMDGPEGEEHPVFGAKIMGRWFDGHGGHYPRLLSLARFCNWIFGPIYRSAAICPDDNILAPYSTGWRNFTLYHSRFLAKRDSKPFSRLCVADKLGLAMTWRWLYLIQANLTGEINEYMRGQGARTPAGERSQWRWITDVQAYVRAWAWEHRDGRSDEWTGSKRDLCINDNAGGAA